MNLRSILFVAALGAVASAHAVVVNYTNQQAWETAVDFSSKIRFTSLADGAVLTNQYAAQGVTFDGSDNVYANGAFLDGFGVNAHGALTVNFASSLTAFGTVFPGGAHIDLYQGATLVGSSSNFGSSGTGFFGGVVSSVAFNKVVVSDYVDGLAFVDDIQYGAAAVPEPATLAVLGLGLLGLRRRKRQA